MTKERLKVIALGALEAAGAGFLFGAGSLLLTPGDVTLEGLNAGMLAGAQTSVIYLIGYLRKNSGLT